MAMAMALQRKLRLALKIFLQREEKMGDLIGKKCPDFINPMKNERQLLTQSGTGP